MKTRLLATLLIFTQVLGGFSLSALHANSPVPQRGGELSKEQRETINGLVRDSSAKIFFEKNAGQFAKDVRYGFKTKFGAMLVYDDHLRIASNQVNPATNEVGQHIVDMTFPGSDSHWQIVPGDSSGVTGSYQKDGTSLKPDLFTEITLRDVYTGVDLRLYSAGKGVLEFDWIVARAQDYEKIRIAATGQDGVTFHEDGSAELALRFQSLMMKMPEVYQVIGGEKHAVSAAMVAGETPGVIRYALAGDIVRDQPLVIDPNIAWSTYFDLNDSATPFDSYVFAINVNLTGVYVSGWVGEVITNGSFAGYMEVNAGFVQGVAANESYLYRLNTSGTNITAWTSTGIVSSTGGVTNQAIAEEASDLELFPDGRVLLAWSSGRLQIYSADLVSRPYSAEPIAVDMLNSVAILDNNTFYASGRVNAALAGVASIGPDTTFAGALEGFIIRYTLVAGVPTPDWGTYIGGDNSEYFTAIALTPDHTKLVFTTNTLLGANYPALVNAVDSTPGAAATTELLVGVLNEQATVPAAFDVFSFLGGSGNEGLVGSNTTASQIVATNTYFYVAGNTASADLPATAGGAQIANAGGLFDVFASRIPLNGSLGTGFQSTYIGGNAEDNVGGITYDTRANRILVYGTTAGGTFPVQNTTPGSGYYDGTLGGGLDIFLTTYSADLTVKEYASIIGGTGNDYLGQTGDLIGQGHMGYSNATGLCYLATTVHSNLPQLATPENALAGPGKDKTKSNAGNDTHYIVAFNSNTLDFGDAPVSYENGDPARDAASFNFHLGLTVDAEGSPFSSALADGDDLVDGGSPDDEDGIASLAALTLEQTSYTNSVSVFNNTGSAQTLRAWIDFNQNGLFEASEFTSVAVPTNVAQQTVSLTWAAIPIAATKPGLNFMRLRLSDAALVDNAGTAAVDERSIGVGNAGEIEDYAITVTGASLAGTVYSDDNNNGLINVGEVGINLVSLTLTGVDNLGNNVNVTTTTDTNGNYSFIGLRPSNASGYTITETQPAGFSDGKNTVGSVGGVTTNVPATDIISAIPLALNVAGTGYNFGELPGSTVTGHLYIDTNGNGTQNLGEPDLANVDVIITDSLGATQTVATNASGNWTVIVPPGSTTANVDETDPQFPAGATQTEGTDPTTVTAIANSTVSAGIDGYFIPATVTGHLYIDTNGNGVQNAGEPDLANVDVVITNSLGVNQTVVTNASGNWTASVPPGSTTANVSEVDPQFPVGAVQTEGTDPTTVTAVAGVSTNGGTDGYFIPATVTGHLYIDTNGNGVQNVGEPDLANVDVVITNSLGVNQTVVTNASGNWTASVPPGSTTANVSEADPQFPVGAVQTEGTDPTTVTAVAGVSTNGGTDGYLIPATVTGHLYIDTNGNGVQNAGEPDLANVDVVITNSLGVNQTVVTNASGNWTVSVPPGSTTANVSEADPQFPVGAVQTEGTDPTTVTAVAGVSTNGGTDGYLIPATVTGHLYIDTNGNGTQNAGEPDLANVDVVITNSLGVNQTVVTNASGNWTASVPPGSTTANVSEADPQFPVGAVQTEGTDPTTVTAVAGVSTNGGTDGYLIPATVTGHLYIDTNGNGTQNAGEPDLANVDVVITNSLGVNQTVVTNASGNWTASVPPGSTTANVSEADPQFPVGAVQTEGTDPTTVTAVAGVSTNGGTDGYLIPATVTGHLYIDTNGNGTQNIGEPDLANVDVVITNSLGVNQTVVTNASGNWTASVPPGSTTANVSEADPQFPVGAVQTEGTDPTTVTAVAGVSTNGGTDGYFVPATVTGHLYVDTNGNGVQNVGEPNIANVNIVVTNSLGVNQTVVTNASGNWTAIVPPGSTTANVDETDPDFIAQVPVGFVETEGTDPTTVTAFSGASTSAGNDGYFIPAPINGHLYVDTNGNGTQDVGEPNIANVNVVITNSLGVNQTVVTNASGNWTATVPPGSTTANVDETDPDFIAVVPAGFVETQGNDPTVFTAVANVNTSGGIDGYFNPATVTGHLYIDTNGNGTQNVGEPNLANVDVVITNSLGATQTVVTNASGNWTATVPPGSTTANVSEVDPQFPVGAVQTEGTDPTTVTAVANVSTNGGTDGYFVPATVTGHLYVDTNGNGTQNVGEPNIVNVNVVITNSLGVNQTVVTNASGNWTATVPPGSTTANVDETDADFIAVVPAGFVETEGTDPTTVTAVAGVSTSAGIDGYFNPAPINGHLYVDTNGNGSQDVGEPNITNVNVVITNSLGVNQTVVTNASGNWTATVPPGSTTANVDETDPDFIAVVPAGFVETQGNDPTVFIAVANVNTSGGIDGYFNPATVTGHLYLDTNGNGVQNVGEPNLANVDVVITNSLGATQTVATNASGNWTATVPPGSTTANVSEIDPQFPAGVVQTEGTDPTTVTAVANVSTNGGTDGYFTPAIVTGHLYIDTNGNGVQNVGEPNLSNVDVIVTTSLGTTVIASTDGSGNWSASVPPGSTSANVDETDLAFSNNVPAGYVETEGTDPTVVTAVAGVSTSAGNDGYFIPATVTGHLYVDTNGNGVQDVGEPDLAGVDVVITNSNGVAQTVVTNASGNWTATVPPGSTSANVSEVDPQFPAGGVQTEGNDPTVFTAVANASVSGGIDGYFVPAPINGHLYVDTNGNGVQDGAEPNLANVDVLITDSLGATKTVTTNASGNWTTTVPPGTTSANVNEADPDFSSVVPAGFVETQGNDPTTFTAVANVNTSGGIDGYFIPATITGHLYLDTNGNGVQNAGEPDLAGVNVVITDSLGATQTLSTNASGNWTTTVPPGSTSANVDETDPQFPAGSSHTEGTDPTAFTAVANVSTSGGIDGYFIPAILTGHLYVDTNGNGTQDVGEPNLANVDVLITNSLGATQTVTTDGSGNWTASVPPGSTSANVDETDPQFPAGGVQREGTDPTITTAVAGTTTNGGTDGYFVPAPINGHLYVDTNGNGVQDGAEPNLANVDVVITDSLGATKTVTTNASGNWTTTVPPGSTSANVTETDPDFTAIVPAGYIQTQGDDPTTFTAVANVNTTGGIDGYYIPATITGHLYIDTNGNGTQDIGEPNLPNINVIVTDVNGTPHTVTTNITGDWTASVPPGNTSANVDETDPDFITQVPAGYTQTEGNDPTPFVAVANATTSGGIDGYKLPASALHRISGVVFLDGPANNNIFDAADVRVPNVTVKLYRDINGDGIAQLTEFVASTVTIGDGSYAFPVQPNGPYLVAETNPGGTSDADADGPVNTNDLIVVPLAGLDVTARNFLDDGYVLHSISGAVTDGTNPIPGTIITLKNAAGDILAVIPTLLDGSYSFPNLPDGIYTVNETNPVGVTGGSDVDSGNPDLITVTLAGVNIPGRNFIDLIPAPSLHALSGTVYKDGPANNNTFDALDLPVANATITLYRDINGDGIPQASEFVGTTVTLIGGGYRFARLGDGAYLIAETNPTAAISDADADGVPNTNDLIAAFVLGADVPVQDFLDDAFSLAAISGFVSDGTAKTPGVLLTLRNGAGDILGTTLTDALGNYRFTGLPNGTYTVTETNPPGTIGGSDYDAGNPDVSNVTITGVDVPNVNFYDLIPANIPARVIYGYCKTPLMVNALRNLPPTGGTWRIVSVGRAKHGSVQIRPNGFVLYRSSINFNGKITDSFVVTLTDGTSTIQKTITVKDFASIAGTFQGMLAPTGGGFAGRATITLVNKATFTTQIAISGETLRVAGTLTGSLHYEKNLRLKNGGHTLLKLDYDDLSDTWGVALTGDVTLAAASPVARALKTATAFVGRSTSAFTSGVLPPSGFGSFNVTKTGATKVIGHIAGGGAYVMSASLLANGQASYYLSTNSFSLAGILGYTGPQAAPVGSLRWQYTAVGGAHADVALTVAGTHYTKPVGTASILGSVIPSLKFELLDNAVTTLVPVQSPAQPTVFTGFSGPKQFKLTFDSTTGIAIGAYKETAKSFNLHGVVLQSAAKAVGITDSLTDPTASWKLIAN